MYMVSLGMCGKNSVGSDFKSIMPPSSAFRVVEAASCESLGTMKEALPVSEAYGTGPEVMERKKNIYL